MYRPMASLRNLQVPATESMKYTKEQFAALLNGREYGDEITDIEEIDARNSDLVVVFGYSDDNAELRGHIHDEIGCYEGNEFYVTARGLLPEHCNSDCQCKFCGYEDANSKARFVRAVWGKDGFSWTYETDIPHATFEVMEEGQKYCRGIVFSIQDLQPKGAE